MKPTEIATAVPYNPEKDRFLLTRRTTETSIHPGKWDFPGGHIEDEKPGEATLRELEEETGLKGKIIRTGESFILDTVDGKFKIHPFLILVKGIPELNEEHTEFKWIKPEDLENFQTVKGLKKDLRKLDIL